MKFALFENTLDENGISKIFIDYIEEICIFSYEDLTNAYSKITEFQNSNYYVIGYLAYDLLNTDSNNKQPCLHFVAYKTVLSCPSHLLIETLTQHNIAINESFANPFTYLESEIDSAQYTTMFNEVQEHLKLGNSYQINLTQRFNLDISTYKSFAVYYHLSRQNPVRYAAYLPFEPNLIISISPELFFQKTQDQIIVKPMKGTAQRSLTHDHDMQIKELLHNDKKNRAENLIIVDLLRNDLAKFAQAGTITVDKLFEIEEYATLFQMTSQIHAQVKTTTSLQTIISGLFPCGSITGAPKKKTLELISQIEQSSRGVYTGSIGYLTPENDMLFNVAIRTITQANNEKFARIGAGGGITINSTADSEWNEINTKLKFITRNYLPDFKLIESLLISNGRIINLDEHLTRLKSSADKLLFSCDSQQIKTELIELVNSEITLQSNQNFKLRIELDYSGSYLIEYAPIPTSQNILQVMLLNQQINTNHPLFKHKTTSPLVRGLYTQLDSQYKPAGIDEILLLNENNIATETRFHNIIIEINHEWLTSPISSGLLGGIYRQKLIQSGKVKESIITKDMLKNATNVFLCNDVRGIIHCNYCGEIN